METTNKQTRSYLVAADIEYLDGTLKGLLIPDGYRVHYPKRGQAERVSRWIERTIRTNDFIRATGTGNRYVFKSVAMIKEL